MRTVGLLVGSLLAGLVLLACQPEADPARDSTPAAHRSTVPMTETQHANLDSPAWPSAASRATPSPPSQTLSPTAGEVPPTLTASQQRIELSKLLLPDEACRLPCWWGLVPEETSWVEAERVLSRLSARMLSRPAQGGRILHGVAGLNITAEHVDIWLSIWERAGRVDEIRVTAAGDRADPNFETLFRRRLRPFFPDRVLEQYGPPEAVGVALKRQNRMSVLALELLLIYDGFEIHYQGAVPRGESNHRICPLAGQIGVIRLDLRPSSPTPIEGLYLPIERAAEIDSQGFYNRFRGSGPTTCIETPADLWP